MKPTLIVAIVVCAAVSTPAYGYIDPGTGSLIIQGLIGTIAALSVTAKVYWHKIKIFLAKESDDTSPVLEEVFESQLKENSED